MGRARKEETVTALVEVHRIERSILWIRGQRVMLDADLAILYRVPTKVLNQAVRRNRDRFPKDFTPSCPGGLTRWRSDTTVGSPRSSPPS